MSDLTKLSEALFLLKNPTQTKPDFWNNVSPQLKRAVKGAISNTWGYYYNTNSRTLTDTLRRTFFNWDENNLYKFLLMCSAIIPGMPKIRLIPKYSTIDSEMAQTYTLNEIRQSLPDNDTSECVNIIIWAIPRGKSYLKKALSTSEESLKEIKPFEQLYAQYFPTDFVEVYQDLKGTTPKDITVFTERPTEALVTLILIMLPHLLNIVPRETSEGVLDNSEEGIAYNEKVIALRNIYAVLFGMWKNPSIDGTVLLNELLVKLTEYANKFDFVTTNISSFLENLANAKNRVATSYFKERYENVQRTIARLEADLLSAYEDKKEYERNLIAHKSIAPDDVKPFMETIQTSPAIEIISTSVDTLVLRVTAPFQYFTESDFQIQEDNPNSTFNNYIGYRKTLKTILHKVFVTREYKLIAQALISLKINETNYSNTIISANIIQHAGPDGLEDYTEFPNPHLWHYNCWNTARTEMAKNLAAGKYELAVLQMVAAVQSLNIAENASFNNGLVADLTSRPSLQKLAHFIIEDGTILSLPELIEHEENLEKEQALEKAKEALKTQAQEYRQVELPNIAWEGEDDATN